MSRGGSNTRGKSNGAKVSAPVPMNLPSRRHEKGGHDVSLVSSGSSWGSPSAVSTAVLGSTSSASSSPTADGTSPLLTTASQGQGGDSPKPDAQAGSPFQKAAPRAWGTVAQTSESNLAEYPTAAEAAKKLQEHQGEHQGNGNLQHHTSISNSNSGTKPSTAITTSGEPMAKTVSAMSGGDNWDEADDDEGVDFLNAAAIEFADGSVVVAAAVAQKIDTPEEAESQQPAKSQKAAISQQPTTSHQPTESHTQEERVVERGDVGFDRSLPNRTQPATGHSLYQPNHEQGSRYGSHDRSQASSWQGGPTDRRLSSDRSPGYHPNQRRESFGNRDHSGPPRRDSYDRREPPNRSGSYSRERDMPYRENDFGPDRRRSHDRQAPGSDRFSDRPQRDFQLLSRPKDGPFDRSGHFSQGPHPHAHSGPYDRSGLSDRTGPLDRVDTHHRMGPHDVAPSGHRGFGHHQQPVEHGQYDPPRLKDGHDSRLGGHPHMGPQGVVEYDRPAQVTEEQREAMKHAAEEARRRRQEEEARIEESKARARARADELFKKSEEARLAKEKEERDAKEREEQAEFGNPAERPHMLELNDEEQKDALAKWQALPGRLAKEDADRVAQTRERRRIEEAQKALAANSTAAAATSATSLTSVSATSTTPVVGPWRRGQPLTPKAKTEIESKADSTITPAKKDEKAAETSKTASPSTHGVVNEPRVEQLDKVMHRIEESFQSRGNSVQAMEANMKRPADGAEQISLSSAPTTSAGDSDKTAYTDRDTLASSTLESAPIKEKVRNAKASRAEKNNGDSSSWRKDDVKGATAKEGSAVTGNHGSKISADGSKVLNGTAAVGPRPVGNGRMSRSAAAAAYSKGNYPAKANGLRGAAKIADITKIHARLSLQSAGDQKLEPSDKDGAEGKSDQSAKTKGELTKSGASTKRNSLSASTASTIFPDNVEKAARNRGSMSFMVDSEIDLPISSDINAHDGVSAKTSLDAPVAVDNLDEPSKQTWNHIPDPQDQQPKAEMHPHPVTPQSMDMLPAGTSTHMFDPSGNRAPSQHGQHIWGGSTGVESTSQGGGPHAVMMAAPGVSGPPHPPQSYPVMMPPPYYIQGYHQPPFFYQRPMAPAPHMNAFPGTAIPPPFGAVPLSSADARGSPEMANQALTAVTTGSSDLQNDVSNQAAASPSNSILGPHHWLPRFSVAGDAPPQQAIVSAGPFMVPPPIPQQAQANIMAAANINRVPQPRPYGHHPHQMMHQQPLPPHSLKHPGRVQTSSPASLESSFQEGSGSPTAADGWNSPATLTSSSSTSTSPASSGGRNHGPGQIHSWAPGVGRAAPMGGAGGSPSGGYGNYQPMPHHMHPNSGRGGRGGYGNYHPARDYRPRGGYVGHVNQSHLQGHPSSYSYSHHQQHGGQPVGVSSGVSGSIDTTSSHVNQQHSQQQHPQHLASPQAPRVPHSAVATPASSNPLPF
ncbi:hypothetical protein BGZ95_011483 [Linnemannia exigua]|uniref:BAT2 N-terminal domain-containing protein n=1 Tax=Linnemannia exigua TaxID=604196 RepID=A0AAD4H978_9FUNG|nr:hypothetical protein BGZ95_011483 [Linnemannia exigua]